MKFQLIFLILFFVAYSYTYLPGFIQKTYKDKEVVEVKTRKLASRNNLPFDFYSLKFCQPNPKVYTANNLGELFFGDRIENSLYQMNVNQQVHCKFVKDFKDECKDCETKTTADCKDLTKKNVEDFIQKITDGYDAQLIIDNLPVANIQRVCGEVPDESDYKHKISNPDGLPIGCKVETKDSKEPKEFYLNNHYTFVISYFLNEEKNEYSIVGATAVASSVKHTATSCNNKAALSKTLGKIRLTDDLKSVPWSYSVYWIKSDIKWASRWDHYLNIGETGIENKIHWFSIVNSLMIVFFLTGMVAMIMMRALHKDITIYNNEEDEDDITDESGWKHVHGDVFRRPFASTLLSITIGTGVQILGMTIVTIGFSILGFLSPSNRGGIFSIMLLLFVLMGSLGGYYSMRFYKMFDGEYWKIVSIFTGLMFPGIVFTIFFILNFIVWTSTKSTLAIPFLTLLILLGMWLGVSLPLVLLGGFFGYRADKMKNPKEVHKIPKLIPVQPWYMSPIFSIMMGGLLPFGAVFIEIYFVMSSIWLQKFYYLFGFLFLVFIILILTCSEITIVMIYFQLCSSDFRWWWRSFLTAGSSSIYLFLYSGFYFVTKLRAFTHVVMSLVYFSYMFIISYFFFMLTGTIGFFATYWFVRYIYASIKTE